MLLRHAIGHVLRRIRLDRRLTLRDLARRSQVSVPYLSEIERGRKEASSEILATVCRVLDLSVGELLTAVSLELGGAEESPATASGIGAVELAPAAPSTATDSAATTFEAASWAATDPAAIPRAAATWTATDPATTTTVSTAAAITAGTHVRLVRVISLEPRLQSRVDLAGDTEIASQEHRHSSSPEPMLLAA
jgi:transcriptional regulator with XRE-family HTH domain